MEAVLRIIIIIIFLSANAKLMAQCCSAGNPVGGLGTIDGLESKELLIATSYKYSLSSEYYHQGHAFQNKYVDKSFYDFINTSLSYGITQNFGLQAEIGYFVDKSQQININNEEIIIKSNGIGDLGFNTNYTAFRKTKPFSMLILSFGTKLPVGNFDEVQNGITIPISLQPSSGALKYNFSVFYSYKKTNKKIGWHTYSMFEISNTINKEFLVYKYGNYFQYSFAINYSLIKNLLIAANTKFEWRGRDTRESEMLVESSGSKVIIINPQLFYKLKKSWDIIFISEIPVYKYVNGYQLTNKLAVQVGLRKSFSFCKTNS